MVDRKKRASRPGQSNADTPETAPAEPPEEAPPAETPEAEGPLPTAEEGRPEAGAMEPPPETAPEEQIADLKDRLLRAMAEVENVRRRAERDRTEASKYSITALARDLLTVADNLRRALEAVPEEPQDGDDILNGLLTGVEMTERELLNAFDKHGIKPIDPLGEKFDHNFHQAMFELENTGQPPGTIVEVMQIGYLIRDRLLRPAMVGIAKGKPEPPGGAGAAA